MSLCYTSVMNTKALLNWQQSIGHQKRFAFLRDLARQYPKSRVYLVGGLVRDLLLGRGGQDIDFVVTGVGAKALSVFLQKHGKVNFVGKAFGVFKFSPGSTSSRSRTRGSESEALDVALPRVDVYAHTSGAYRDVKVESKASLDIEDDLRRRDFTINALAWSLTENKLIDLGDGVADLKKKVLRTVGRPEERFAEDYTRLLRALRFSIELKFVIEPKTWRSIKKLTPHLNDKNKNGFVVPRELVAKEFLKALVASPVEALRLFDESGAFKTLMPELLTMKRCPQPKNFHAEGDVWQHTQLSLSMLSSKSYKRLFKDKVSAEIALAVLLHDVGKPATLRTPARHKVDRIRFDGHDVASAEIARNIATRLKLDAMPADTNLHVSIDHLDWAIKNHLLLLNDNANKMKATTIEKYFIKHPAAILLQQVMWCDSLATVSPKGRPVVRHLTQLRRRLKKLFGTKLQLPSAMLTGDEIMKTLKIPSGQLVGRAILWLREEQLNKKIKTKSAARTALKRWYEIYAA